MNKERHYLDGVDMNAVRDLVRRNGLRPVLDAVATAALEDAMKGDLVLDEYGQRMDEQDIHTAAHNVIEGDLY